MVIHLDARTSTWQKFCTAMLEAEARSSRETEFIYYSVPDSLRDEAARFVRALAMEDRCADVAELSCLPLADVVVLPS